MVALSFDSQQITNNSDCHYISKQGQQTVQIISRDRECLGTVIHVRHVKTPAQTCLQHTEVTLKMFWKISTSSCHQVPNELSNLLAVVATCLRWLQLARLKLSTKYQCSGGSLQSSHQKTIRFDCNNYSTSARWM